MFEWALQPHKDCGSSKKVDGEESDQHYHLPLTVPRAEIGEHTTTTAFALPVVAFFVLIFSRITFRKNRLQLVFHHGEMSEVSENGWFLLRDVPIGANSHDPSRILHDLQPIVLFTPSFLSRSPETNSRVNRMHRRRIVAARKVEREACCHIEKQELFSIL